MTNDPAALVGRHGLAVPALLLAAACSSPPPADRVRASGHVEATETRLAPEQGGRIITMTLKEGDRIQAGQTILTLDRRDLELALRRAHADQAQAEAQLRLVLAGSREEDIRQAESQLAAAQAEVSAVRADLQSADQDLQRFELLLETKSGSLKQRDDAATRKAVAADRLAAAESRAKAQSESLARLRAGARREEVDIARARVAAAAAQVATVEKSLGETVLVSPVNGVVTQKLVEPGEVIPPRTPIAVVVDLDHAWADVFVPEPAVPKLRIGQSATVFTDAGGAGLAGTVTYISPKAEFTPRNVQTAEERSKLVYRVRISVDNTAGVLKQGMPVEAELPFQP
jgi:HlyD family secretion protein